MSDEKDFKARIEADLAAMRDDLNSPWKEGYEGPAERPGSPERFQPYQGIERGRHISAADVAKVRELLRAVEKVGVTGGWVPCETCLPDRAACYLVVVEVQGHRFRAVARYLHPDRYPEASERWSVDEGPHHESWRVTHWRELPPLPEVK